MTYTVISKSGHRKIELESDVVEPRQVKEAIKSLEESCESSARELWGDDYAETE